MNNTSHESRETILQHDIDELKRPYKKEKQELTDPRLSLLQAIGILKRLRREHLNNPQTYRIVFDAYKYLKELLDNADDEATQG